MYNNSLALQQIQKAFKFLSGRCLPTHLLRGHPQTEALIAQNLNYMNSLAISPFLLDCPSVETKDISSRVVASVFHTQKQLKILETHYHERSQPRGPVQANGTFSASLKSRGKESPTDVRSSEKMKASENLRHSHWKNQTNNCFLNASFITSTLQERKGIKSRGCHLCLQKYYAENYNLIEQIFQNHRK